MGGECRAVVLVEGSREEWLWWWVGTCMDLLVDRRYNHYEVSSVLLFDCILYF